MSDSVSSDIAYLRRIADHGGDGVRPYLPLNLMMRDESQRLAHIETCAEAPAGGGIPIVSVPRKHRVLAEFMVHAATCALTLADTVDALRARAEAAEREVERLRQRVLSAAGDDLCRLTQDEIKAYTSGAVQIPPEGEFIASCKRFHAQIAGTAGVLGNCLTLAQMIAENERLRAEVAAMRGGEDK